MTELGSLRKRLERFVAALDPDAYDGAAAARAVEEFAAIGRLADAGRTLAARRVAETAVWSRQGDRSPAHWLARTSGVGLGEAIGTLETARRLEELPTTESALRAGRLSRVQVGAVAAAATADPGAERALVHAAAHGTVKGLKERCARVTAAARDDTDHYLEVKANRCLRTWNDHEGSHLHLQSTPESVATVLSAIKPYEHELFDAARTRGGPEPVSAYAADALVAMAADSLTASRPGASRGPRAELRIRVDLPAFERGHAEAGETCEIPGVGPVPVALARSVASDAVIDLIVTQGTDVHAVVSRGRTIPRAVQVALEEMYPTCAERHCDVREHLENDHIEPFDLVRETRLANLVRWCRYHHHLKTYRGYVPVRGPDGRWSLIPPDRSPPEPSDPTPTEALALAV